MSEKKIKILLIVLIVITLLNLILLLILAYIMYKAQYEIFTIIHVMSSQFLEFTTLFKEILEGKRRRR